MAQCLQGSEIMLLGFYKLRLDFGFTFIFYKKKRRSFHSRRLLQQKTCINSCVQFGVAVASSQEKDRITGLGFEDLLGPVFLPYPSVFFHSIGVK